MLYANIYIYMLVYILLYLFIPYTSCASPQPRQSAVFAFSSATHGGAMRNKRKHCATPRAPPAQSVVYIGNASE